MIFMCRDFCILCIISAYNLCKKFLYDLYVIFLYNFFVNSYARFSEIIRIIHVIRFFRLNLLEISMKSHLCELT